jgi:hypothetical protein
MDPDKLKAVVEAIKTDDKDAAMALLEQMLVDAAAGTPAITDDGSTDPAALAEHPEEGGEEDMSLAHEGSEHEDEEDEDKALAKALKTLTGKSSAGEAVEEYKRMKARVDVLDREHAALELSARRELVADLIKMGVETPALAWDGEPEDRKPVARLAAEPIDGLRARVKALSKSRPTPLRAPVKEEHQISPEIEARLAKIPGATERYLARQADKAARKNAR